MGISVIIPVLNEAKTIEKFLNHLTKNLQNVTNEIIFVDGGSSDFTLNIIKKYENVKLLEAEKANRALQMNLGAKNAKFEILYFLHADCFPPKNFHNLIFEGLKNFDLGCFCAKYDSKKFIFKVNSWFTKLPFEFCRGGDQSLFISKSAFNNIGKFDETFEIMEEYDFLRRAKKLNYKFAIIPKPIKISLRKYENKSWLKVNKANLKAIQMFKRNVPSKQIKDVYLKMLG